MNTKRVEGHTPTRKHRMMPAWIRTTLLERLDLCVTFLVIHGVLTDAEKERVTARIQKRLSKGEYYV